MRAVLLFVVVVGPPLRAGQFIRKCYPIHAELLAGDNPRLKIRFTATAGLPVAFMKCGS
jgi:hypothetical protein